MSKRFKDKTCVYCGNSGSTADHIFARQFFPVERRDNLPQVCACQGCNGAKAELEHYLSSVLPFGGPHRESGALLESAVPARLARNRKLHLSLAEGRQTILVREDGVARTTLALPFDSEKLFSLLGYVARALVAYHWDIIVPQTHFSRGSLLTDEGDLTYRELFMRRCRAEAQGNLGNGLILYQGVQAIDRSLLTLWRFRIYGGMNFLGDPRSPSEVATHLWSATAHSPPIGFQ